MVEGRGLIMAEGRECGGNGGGYGPVIRLEGRGCSGNDRGEGQGVVGMRNGGGV